MAEDAPAVDAANNLMDKETAAAKVLEGKALIDTDPEKAVELLCAAVRAFEKHYGVEGLEIAQVYMYYGMALFEAARKSSDAVGGGLANIDTVSVQKLGQDAPESAAAGDKGVTAPETPKAENGEKGSALDPAAEAKNPNAEQPIDDTDAENVGKGAAGNEAAAGLDNDSDAEDEVADGDAEDEVADGDAEEEGGDGDDEEAAAGSAEDDTTDDMKLAWEMLELARLIFSKQPNHEEHNERLAEIHRALGDMKAEAEHFEEAVESFKQSLQLLETVQPRNNRRMAEVQYMLSLNLTFMERHEEALQVTREALSNLQAAVAETEEKLAALPTDGSGGDTAEEQGQKLQKVSDDLQGVISELQSNVEGLEETIANNKSMKETLKQAFLKSSTEGNTTNLTSALVSAAATTGKDGGLAMFKAAAGVQAISLGTVGRGSKRITLLPTNTVGALQEKEATTAPGGLVSTNSTKRTLEELIGGAPIAGNETSIGFCAVAVVEKREEGEDQQPAKKPRVDEDMDAVAAVASVDAQS